MNEMRAALYDRFGPPEVLYEGSVPVPVRAPGEVLVRVRAVGVNGGELSGRAGRVKLVTGRRFPLRMGIDFVGEVAEVAEATGSARSTGQDGAAPGPRRGDVVWGGLGRRLGSAAEYVAVRPRQISLAPENLTPAEAVSLLAGGTTSLTALRDKARIRPGERLLVRGGSGGVGSVAVQLGKMFGARVTALAGPRNLDFVRELGADEVIDYTTARAAELGSFDVVMDTVGTELASFRKLLSPGGRMVSVTFDADHILSSVGYILWSAVHGTGRVRAFSGNPRHAQLAELAGYARDGAVRPVVDTVRPLAEIAAAHRALEAGGVRGKHVVEIG
ncbi:NAD(P)-dependent alcohol dehydrogenase [Streptomyces corynorhini]|uniref:NAD(P)-dependent alcohol dehydrogenase n=1 Tax=Streptomyces corynorhini TaxID=2282652 RepID=A0A370B1N4_9ACTN|nr:NAD(P)-dependent alcohol dehydrogenase [Streptomyces corynorhini]RDG35777.1 NAD(P)-dependent alcohol dehydrogenase [Streptomyces corynorhini]